MLNAERDSGDPILTYRQLDVWYRTGLIDPLISGPTSGSGSHRAFSEDEIAIITIMAQLVYAGMRPSSAGEYARMLRGFFTQAPAEREISIRLSSNFKLVLIWPEEQ